MEVPQNGGFIRENPIETDALGVPLFSGNHYIRPLVFLDSRSVPVGACAEFPSPSSIVGSTQDEHRREDLTVS